MSGGRKKSGFLITSVTSDCGASPGAGGPEQPAVDGHQGGAAAPSSPPDPSRGPEERGPPDGSGSPPASRFRVVRLRRALGQPYRRGRWTCVDVLDREARLLAGLRHAHSLDSLDSLDALDSLGGAAGLGATPLPHPFRPLRPGHLVHSQGTTHLLASSVAAGDTAPRQPLSGPPSPRLGPAAAGTARHRRLPPPLRMDAPLGQALSRPGSPGDASPPRVPCPSRSPSRLALAQSVFGVGGAFQLDEDSSLQAV
ncbi:TSC22 domain family protein 4 [Lepisosteus oculatus]|uniref:TSC22 domain family protein 4 n=1 Tax=Lepisosteus oculatus TaxID=7918 RepID=UPI00371D10CC